MRTFLLIAALFIITGETGAQAAAGMTIRGPDGREVVLDAARLAALPRVSGTVSDHGTPATYRGIPLRDVLRASGVTPTDSLRGPLLRRVLVFVGADGYRAVVALGDLDPSLGARAMFLVDEQNGAALPPTHGPWRLIVDGDLRAARWVRQVVRIEVTDMP